MSNTKDAVIGLLNASLKERDERVAILRTIIQDSDSTIGKQSRRIEVMGNQIMSFSDDITKLNKDLVIKDTIILDLKKSIEEQANALRDMRKVIKERDVTISSLHLSLGEAYERDTDNYCNPE